MGSKPTKPYEASDAEKMYINFAARGTDNSVSVKDKIRYTEDYLHSMRMGTSYYTPVKETYLENYLAELRGIEKTESAAKATTKKDTGGAVKAPATEGKQSLPTPSQEQSKPLSVDTSDSEAESKLPFFDFLNNNLMKNAASPDTPRRKNTWFWENITENTPKADTPGRTSNTRYRPYSFDVDIQPKALGIINEQLKGGLSVPTIAISLAGMGEINAIGYANILMDFVRGKELDKKSRAKIVSNKNAITLLKYIANGNYIPEYNRKQHMLDGATKAGGNIVLTGKDKSGNIENDARTVAFKENNSGKGDAVANWYDAFLRIPEDAKKLYNNFISAQSQRSNNIKDPLSFMDWFTYGYLSANENRGNVMLNDPSIYNIGNWLSSGLFDTIKGTFNPDEPLSLQHWLDSFGTAATAITTYNLANSSAAGASQAMTSSKKPTILDDLDDTVDDTAKSTVKGAGKSYNAAKAAKWKKPDGSTWWPDDDGFVGTPTKETLQPGTKIDRYGNSSGKFAAPGGTPYGQRSLAPGSENSPYNSYEVVRPFDVNSGTTAPWFDQPGGGTQYHLPMSIQELRDLGYIRIITK